MTMAGILMAMLWLFGCAVVEAQISCEPQVVLDDLKVGFHGGTLDGMCHHQSPEIDDLRMVEFCHDFCATGGSMTGLPMQLGAAQYGFNQADMVGMCSDIAESSSVLRGFCSGRQDALALIKERAAELVAGVKIVKAEETAFRAATQKSAADLAAELVSAGFKREVDKAPKVQKIEMLVAKIENFTAQLVNDGGAVADMVAGLENLQNLSVALQDTFRINFPRFEEFITDCNRILLGVGSELEVLLDICPQGSEECIELSTARHVGCCCGLNPVVAPTLTIDGLNASLFEGLGFVAAARRMQSFTSESEVNICAQAKKLGQRGVQAARQRTISYGSGDLLEEEDQLLLTKYSTYYEQCEDQDRSLEWVARPGQTPVAAEAGPEEVLPSQADVVESRHLQPVACTPPVVPNGLKVAFSNTTERDTCHLQIPEVLDKDMQSQCDAFCAGYHSVPLLIGTEKYGFNLSEANHICLPTGDNNNPAHLVHNPAKLEQCKRRSFGFQEIEIKTTQFTSQLEVFTHVQMLYVAQLRNVSRDIHEYITSEDFTNHMRRTRHKVRDFKAVIQEKVDAFSSSVVSFALQNAIAELRRRAQLLGETLDRNILLLQQYLSECNELHLGTGLYDEYLLDVCPQQSVGCIEEDIAGHVSCCCAFHPFTTFGQTVPRATISGIRDFPPPARVTAGRLLQQEADRILQEAEAEEAALEDKRVMDICAEAWNEAREPASQLLACTEETGQAEVAREYEEKMTEIYGENYCGYEGHRDATLPACAVVSTAGTSTITTTRATTLATTSTATTTSTNTIAPESVRSSWAVPHVLVVTVLLGLLHA